MDLSEINVGRSFLFLRGSIFLNKMKSYFSLENAKIADLNPEQTYIFGLHPHGLLPFGGFASFLAAGENSFSTLFPKIDVRLLVASFCFLIPIYRDILLGLGAVDASRFSADRVLASGRSIVVVPGGGYIFSDIKNYLIYSL